MLDGRACSDKSLLLGRPGIRDMASNIYFLKWTAVAVGLVTSILMIGPTETHVYANPPSQVEQAPRLKIEVEADADSLQLGGLLSYTVTVANESDIAAENVWVIYNVPEDVDHPQSPADSRCTFSNRILTCNLGTLTAGGSDSPSNKIKI